MRDHRPIPPGPTTAATDYVRSAGTPEVSALRPGLGSLIPTQASASEPGAARAAASAAGALHAELRTTHTSRFVLPASGASAQRAQAIVRRVLPLMLGVVDDRVRRLVEACLSQLVGGAGPGATGDLLCELRTDARHVFVSVEYERATTIGNDHQGGLCGSDSLADEHGCHLDGAVHHAWAAVRRY